MFYVLGLQYRSIFRDLIPPAQAKRSETSGLDRSGNLLTLIRPAPLQAATEKRLGKEKKKRKGKNSKNGIGITNERTVYI